MQHTAEYFDALFSGNSDPWRFNSRWYEARKRALTLACLPACRKHVTRMLSSPAAPLGELSAALAPRCDSLLVSDGSANAVVIARARLSGFSQARVVQAWVPAQGLARRLTLS